MVLSPADPEYAYRLAMVGAALRPLAVAIGTLAEVEWHSPAGDAYRRLVRDLADDAAGLATAFQAGEGR